MQLLLKTPVTGMHFLFCFVFFYSHLLWLVLFIILYMNCGIILYVLCIMYHVLFVICIYIPISCIAFGIKYYYKKQELLTFHEHLGSDYIYDNK
jgi:apolipoprotein N-acyltransferase